MPHPPRPIPGPSRVPDDDGRPVLGWAHREWTHRVPCVVETCRRPIRAGVVHHKDHADPPRAAMCLGCHGLLMGEPDKFREQHPSEQVPQPRPSSPTVYRWWRRAR